MKNPTNYNLELFQEPSNQYNQLICLGKSFNSENDRRDYFTILLREKLKDPEFRSIEGFPNGSDEDILTLSDPPYYTACPNPWIAEFVSEWKSQKSNEDQNTNYHREPFATDINEGKTHPIYNAHSYHTKVPHRAIMRFILHYTEPGDVIFDGFAGTGMTGVAAQMCGDRNEVLALGYQVHPDGTILREETNDGKNKVFVPFSKIGVRRTVLNDLSPVASFISHNYNNPLNIKKFATEATQILEELRENLGWMYQTKHINGVFCWIDFVIWSEVFTCPDCGSEINFIEEALDADSQNVRKEFPCPSCFSILTKRRMERVFETYIDQATNKMHKRVKYKPLKIHYRFSGKKYTKTPDLYDFEILRKVDNITWPKGIPTNEFPISKMYHGSRIKPKGFFSAHHFFFRRPLEALSYLWEKANIQTDKRTSQALYFFFEQAITSMNVQNRFGPKKYSQSNGALPLVYYIPSQIAEVSPWYILNGKLKRLIKVFQNLPSKYGSTLISTCSTSSNTFVDSSLDYIFTDPPFGANIFYSDLNLIIESWYRVFTNSIDEAVIDKFKKKELSEYHDLMLSCFKKYNKALKPGRWITVEFSNSSAAVWNVIQSTLQEAGFIVANVSSLDKKQGSYRAVTTTTAVKQDLVISAYKPNGGFELRFGNETQTEEGVWDFIRTHLKYLPVTKQQSGNFLSITERDPRILFDQMVAYFVRKGYTIPISSQEFQLGLAQKFIERDGMFFLSEQVAEFDKTKFLYGAIIQTSLFVSDEMTAIQWLRERLRSKPQIKSDIQPDFMPLLSHLKSNEKDLINLDLLLEQNFLKYDGNSQLPEQIHSYLSSNWKEMRNLSKDDELLRKKAMDRWYLPDPFKQSDLEKLREKALIREFEFYFNSKKKLKTFRLEVIRAGFKKAWQERDYRKIIRVAELIPNNILEEDPKLLMWYDQAQTRLGGEEL